MTEQASASPGPKSYRRWIQIEVTLLIACAIGAFTLNGYAHLEKYYLTLDVPIDRLNFSAQKLMAYGGAGVGSYIAALIFVMATVGAITLMLLLLEKPNKKPIHASRTPAWIERLQGRAAELNLPLKFVALIFLVSFSLGFCWFLLLKVPAEAGRTAALRTASECKDRMIEYNTFEKFEGCKVAESDDMLYLLKRIKTDKQGLTFYTIELPKAGLLKIQGTEQRMNYKN